MNEQELGDWLNFNDQKDYRWDIHQNSNFLNIVFHGGTFGNFLRYFIDKFCSLTPDILEEPFTDMGTSHKKLNYSGKVLRYHPSFINDNEGKTDLPICQIIPTTELGYLYLKDSQWYRGYPGGDMQRTIQNIKEAGRMDSQVMDSITSLYNIDQNKSIPKWITRDWYKLEFLDLDKSKHTLGFNYFKNYPFFKKQKTFHFALESFFDYDTFIINLKSLDQYHNLKIDFTRDREMKYIFDKGFNLDKFRIQIKVVEKILDALDKREEIEIPELTVAPEGFLYAHLEKKNDFIQMPLSRDFFKNTREIFDYIDTYPKHYRAMNPLLPTFNGIPNPYYLYAKKKNSK